MAKFNKSESMTKIISIVKSLFPTLVVVEKFQNVSQVVDISEGGEMMTVRIERVIQRGTDHRDPYVVDSWIGDRELQVSFELFSPSAMDKLVEFRDIMETYKFREIMRSMLIMNKRSYEDPLDSTRIHGKTKYVESATLVQNFHITISYLDDSGAIENLNINGLKHITILKP